MVSDPAAAKHVLRSTDNPNRPIYVKGLVQEVPCPLPATDELAGVLECCSIVIIMVIELFCHTPAEY